MSPETRKVGERGQITIPKKFREEKKIKGGDKVELRKEKGKIIVKKAEIEDLGEAYRDAAERAEKVTELWGNVSLEADEMVE